MDIDRYPIRPFTYNVYEDSNLVKGRMDFGRDEKERMDISRYDKKYCCRDPIKKKGLRTGLCLPLRSVGCCSKLALIISRRPDPN